MADRERSPFWVLVAATFFYPLGAALARRVYRGAERIPRKSQGGAIVVMNHVSHLDPMYDAVFIHKQGRLPHFLAKSGLWRYPLVRHVMSGSGQIPVYRESADARNSLRDAIAALNEGGVVIIYPEGTITRDPDGWPMVSRTGVGRLALETDVPVLPVARWGTRSIYDHYNKKFRPFPRGTVTVNVGEPLDLSEYRGKPATGEAARAITDLAMRRVRELLGEIRGEQPPNEFYQPTASGRES